MSVDLQKRPPAAPSDCVAAIPVSADERLAPSRLRDLMTLIKVRIIVMAQVAVAAGAYVAGPGLIDWAGLAATLVGISLVAAASFILNQLLERESDARMARTASRPLPAGRIGVREVLVLGIAAAALGLATLALFVNAAAAFVAALTFSSYVFVYTPLKRHTTLNTLVGAIPGALPPVIGWVSVTGALDLGALALFAILFLWQFPHFFAIAWIYREQYRDAGLAMLPVLDESGDRTSRHIVGTALMLLPVSLLPTLIGLTGTAYLLGAAVLGLVYAGFAMAFALSRTNQQARALFRVSLVYLPCLFILLSLDLTRV